MCEKTDKLTKWLDEVGCIYTKSAPTTHMDCEFDALLFTRDQVPLLVALVRAYRDLEKTCRCQDSLCRAAMATNRNALETLLGDLPDV